MKEPINPALVRVTGDDMVTGVITMKEALEREVDKMKLVYDAAMALAEKWEEYERLDETMPYKVDGDNAERDQLAEDCDRLSDVFRSACRRAKEDELYRGMEEDVRRRAKENK